MATLQQESVDSISDQAIAEVIEDKPKAEKESSPELTTFLESN